MRNLGQFIIFQIENSPLKKPTNESKPPRGGLIFVQSF